MAKFVGKAGSDTLNGTAFGDLIFGLAGNDSLSGGDGPDTLDGGAGLDTLAGGLGSDTYIIDATNDTISDSGGTDRVRASVSIDLTQARFADIEMVALTGSGALKATGNAANNQLIGNSGANTLDGGGGDDVMVGGDGNDTYIVDQETEQVIEFPGGGIDTIVAQVNNFALGNGVENLTIGGSFYYGFGNELANRIVGNAADNHIEAGAGNDTIIGNGGSIDYLYGQDGNDLLNAGGGDDHLDGGAGADIMAGGKGDDSYTIDDKGDKIIEAAGGGTEDQLLSSISYTLGSNVEGLFLSGDGTIGTGNAVANFLEAGNGNQTLQGMAGNDTISDGDGDDVMIGGMGDDEFRAVAGADTMIGGAGKDSFVADSFTDSVPDYIADFEMGVDRIDLTDSLTGYTGANLADYVKTAVVNGSTIVSIDFDGPGGVGFQDVFRLVGIATNLDGLFAQGSLLLDPMPPPGLAPQVGGAGNDTLNGLGQSELLRGLGGNDSLSGDFGFDTLDGGAGADTMAGGSGSDSYVLDSAKDVITETGGADDRIRAALSIDLNKYTGIEHATLIGTAALKVTGDAAANMLIGNSGANTLDGGAGANTLIGGAGNDLYVMNTSVDPETIVELAGEGIDTVTTTHTGFLLAANIENLILVATPLGVGQNGVGNDLANKITALPNSGTGNSSSNILLGFGGNDTLDSGGEADTLDGGTGADKMIGGTGADTYIVDDIGDKITETAGTDRDSVSSTISYTLGANLEDLTLLAGDNINATGNALNNGINGNSGNNLLLGLGGNDTLFGSGGGDFVSGGDGDDVIVSSLGADSLVGGSGKDSYTASDPNDIGTDSIFDFEMGVDRIDLTTGLIGYAGSPVSTNYVQTAIVDGSTIVSIDYDGLGVLDSQEVFRLVGVETDLTGLLVAGSLVFDPAPAIPAQPAGSAIGETLTGDGLSNLLRGVGGNDTLIGNGGADILDGGAGNDSMDGGTGDDTYIVNSAGDRIVDAGGSNDSIRASISIDLTQTKYDGIEHAILTGGTALSVKGDELANLLMGNGGANKLDGGLGADTLIGGGGNDVYMVDTIADIINELPGGGIDTVLASGGYILSDGIENLTVVAGIANGFGNDLSNKLADLTTLGGALHGGGGNDNIAGNAGNDSLFGDDGNDIVNGGVGNDSLDGGTGNDNLAAGAGDDQLDGGIGNDTMNGGAGNDGYTVDSSFDRVIDSGGFDAVYSSISYTMGTGIEFLQLFGSGEIAGTGNAANNSIYGNDSNNLLSGMNGNDYLWGKDGDDLVMGGAGQDKIIISDGADTLVGGAGADRFIFDLEGLNIADVIADFQMGAGGDVLDIGGGITGTAQEREFVSNYVQTIESGGNTIVRVDIDGLGGGSGFVDAFILQGINTDVEGLIGGGNISTALPV